MTSGSPLELPSGVQPLDRLSAPPPARRVLVVRLGSLGDVVRTRFAFPGLRALYPDAQIDWLVEDRAAPGLVGIDGLDEIVRVPRRELRASRPLTLFRVPAGSVRELRARRYDVAVDFHSILKSTLLTWAAGIPVRVGYDAVLAREGSQRLLTHRVRSPSDHLPRFERNALLVRYLGGEVPAAAPPLVLDPADEAAVGPLPEGRFAALHPGTSPTTLYKRWEPERFAEVTRGLLERSGLRTVVTWGPVRGERETAEAVVAASGGAAVLAPATRSLGVLLALLRRAALFVGSDSGPTHLAALTGRPLVVLFGPTDPVENAPYPGVPSRVVRVDVGCNPCREGCPARTCMQAIGPEAVVRAACELVDGASRAS
jgi:heptosyltransferase I